MNQETIWVMSRKISIKSMTRHFAAWKLRQFVLDKKNALLGTRVKTALKLTVIPLSAQTVSVRHHYYSNDQKFCLSLRYSDATVEAGEHEIVMKFENLEKMNKWLKALSDVLTDSKKAFSRRSTHYLKTFNEYVAQQCQMQTALGHRHAVTDGHADSSSAPPPPPPSSARSSQYHSRTMIRSNEECKFWQIPVPKLRILIMAVGTRGDMQPFVMLGLRLQADGHRVRVATHEPFRDYVTGKGLEFYPLAGDPVKLSEFMVKTHGFIIPTSADAFKEVPLHHAMMVEIMHSCWDACVKVDPLDPQERPFIADAIISNPVTYAHIHCAEALGVPLHLMFPQPWVPTKAFPHPLSCLSYQQGWCTENFLSYQVIDSMLWMSFESNINAFRKNVLGLEPVRVGEGGWNMLNRNRVPFVKMWSPTLVPKPKDWPDYVDVVGTFFDTDTKTSQQQNSSSNNIASLNQTKSTVTTHKNRTEATLESEEYSPSPELVTFLKSDVPIIFIGFGSMVIQNIEEIISLFLEAAALANVRVLIQMGWSSISPERFLSMAKEAQQKAKTVREMELLNDDSQDALIFPPGPPPDAEDEGFQLHMGLDSPPRVHKKGSISKSDSGDRTMSKTRLVHKESDPDLEKTGNQSASSGGSGGAGGTGSGAERRPSNTVAPPLVPPPFKSAPSNSVTGLFYTALQTFVVPKKDSSKSPPSSEAHSTSDPHSPHSKASPTLVPSTTGAAESVDLQSDAGPVWSASSDAFFIGPCPHSWLFKHVDAVVHHGGAGTTAAGLRQGCPTWICPFFGDQFFWGELVHRGGLGPRAVSVESLTLDIVAESLTVLRSESMRQAAREISKVLKTEDGVEGAMNAFYRHLPIENMVCDVSMFKGESRLAQVYCKDCGLKLCSEVSDIIHAAGGPKSTHHLVPCSYMNWTVPPPNSAASGIVQGLGGLMHELAEGMSDAVYDPVMGVYAEGLNGGVSGVVSGFHSLARRPFRGGGLLLNRVAVGLKNSLGITDGDSPVRSPTEGESVAGMVYGRDYTSTQNRQIRSMRISGDRANPSEKPQLKDLLIPAGQNASADDRIILSADNSDREADTPSAVAGSRTSEMRQIREAIASEISRVLSDSGMKHHGKNSKPDAAEVEAAAQESAFVIRREISHEEDPSDSSRANSTDDHNNAAGVFTFNAETQDEEAGGELMLSVILESSVHSGTSSTADSIIISINELTHPIAVIEEEEVEEGGVSLRQIDSPGSSIRDDKQEEIEEGDKTPDSPDLPNVSKLTVDQTVAAAPAVNSEELVDSVWLAYQRVLGAQQMFRLLGASNGRFMTMDNFTKMLYRALIRKYADNTEGDSPTDETGGNVNMHDSIIFRVGDPRGAAGSLNLDTVTALVRLLARNKRYLDLVDFILLYQEIIQGGQKWKELPSKIVSTSL